MAIIAQVLGRGLRQPALVLGGFFVLLSGGVGCGSGHVADAGATADLGRTVDANAVGAEKDAAAPVDAALEVSDTPRVRDAASGAAEISGARDAAPSVVADAAPSVVADAAPTTNPDMALPADTIAAFVCPTGLPYPNQLRCTGLYSDWASLAVDPANRLYRPGFELWSDGAAKVRWIYLPPGQKIDVSKPNEWTFPVGTKVWKEFSLNVGGQVRRIETRFFWKKSQDEWARATYLWSQDESAAPEVKDGVAKVSGTDYEIPPQTACVKCHGGRLDAILGFEAVSLAAPNAQGFTYADLQAGGWLKSTTGKEAITVAALAVPGSAVEQKALGYLHANCGLSCHNDNTRAVKFTARLEVNAAGTLGAIVDMGVFKLAVNQISDFIPPGAAKGDYYRIRPSDPARSTFHYLTNRRDPVPDGRNQMPPLATHKVDADGVAAISAWISAMTTANGYPAPGP